jgi:hypothetical protein
VNYKNDFWVVLAASSSDTNQSVRIIRPHVGNEKRMVGGGKCVATGFKTVQVNYRGKDVLVTRKGMLISLVSERLLKNTTPDGMAMLREAQQGQIDFDPDTRSGSTPYRDFA